MKNKLLTVVSASCAVLALASCGGNKSAEKHPTYTTYGTDSLTIECLSGTPTYGKELKLKFTPNNKFAFLDRLTSCKYLADDFSYKYYDEDDCKNVTVSYSKGQSISKYYEDKIIDDIDDILEAGWITATEATELKNQFNALLVSTTGGEHEYPTQKEKKGCVATPYVGFGNWLYPETYPLTRDVSYFYEPELNADNTHTGSYILTIPGEYYQRNVIISFDRSVTGTYDFCTPVEQLGLKDIVGYGNEYYDADPVRFKVGTNSYSTEPDTEYYLSDTYDTQDSLQRDQLSIIYEKEDYVSSYFVDESKINFKVVGEKDDETYYEFKKDSDFTVTNSGNYYYINLNWTAGSDEKGDGAVLEKTDDTTTHPYGYKLKYKNIQVSGDDAVEIATVSDGINRSFTENTNFSLSNDYIHFGRDDAYFGTSKFTSPIVWEPKMTVKTDKYKPGTNMPTVVAKVYDSNGSSPSEVIFDKNDTTNCEYGEFEAKGDDESDNEVDCFYYYIKNTKYRWQLTWYVVKSEMENQSKDGCLTSGKIANFYLAPSSVSALLDSNGIMAKKVELSFTAPTIAE